MSAFGPRIGGKKIVSRRISRDMKNSNYTMKSGWVHILKYIHTDIKMCMSGLTFCGWTKLIRGPNFSLHPCYCEESVQSLPYSHCHLAVRCGNSIPTGENVGAGAQLCLAHAVVHICYSSLVPRDVPTGTKA